MASKPEPHSRLTVTAGFSWGTPERRATWRERVDGVRRGLQRVAKESVVDLISRDARRLDGGLAREHTQIGGSEALQASPESPEGGPLSRKDHDVL